MCLGYPKLGAGVGDKIPKKQKYFLLIIKRKPIKPEEESSGFIHKNQEIS